jgi:hypothetical protein
VGIPVATLPAPNVKSGALGEEEILAPFAVRAFGFLRVPLCSWWLKGFGSTLPKPYASSIGIQSLIRRADPMSSRILFVPLFCISISISLAHAQCPVNTVMIRGRVENPQSNSRIQVQLLYPKQPGESAETNLENNTFRIPVEFITQSTKPFFKDIHPKCDRKPKTVVVTLLSGDQQSDQVSLDLLKDFDHLDASAYTLRQELVLKNQH